MSIFLMNLDMFMGLLGSFTYGIITIIWITNGNDTLIIIRYLLVILRKTYFRNVFLKSFYSLVSYSYFV